MGEQCPCALPHPPPHCPRSPELCKPRPYAPSKSLSYCPRGPEMGKPRPYAPSKPLSYCPRDPETGRPRLHAPPKPRNKHPATIRSVKAAAFLPRDPEPGPARQVLPLRNPEAPAPQALPPGRQKTTAAGLFPSRGRSFSYLLFFYTSSLFLSFAGLLFRRFPLCRPAAALSHDLFCRSTRRSPQ